ncbi:major facilitator family transporter [Desulfosporosinus sp. I2]|uniref:MFS transporter n=1 Tax=Desulfosporosinus sp. I2 TaxID=1617025 RepID=UPI0005F03A50|nr:MFS transporter [Desulfosporosinus sp. I2]KJR49071.1 major facilitator family transporter [Desulfosporosinus sp. I2]
MELQKSIKEDKIVNPKGKDAAVILFIFTGILVVLGSLGFGRFSMALILPSMQKGLGFNYSQMGIIVTAAFLGYLSFSLGSGIAAARWGSSKIITFSLYLTGFSMVLTGLGSGFFWPLIWLALAGVGMAGANIPVMAMTVAWVPAERRGFASGLLVSGSGLGLLINGFLLPRLISAPGGQGWRTAWICLGIAVIIIGIWTNFKLKDQPANSSGFTQVANNPMKESIWKKIIKIFREKPVLRRLALIYFAFGFSYVIFTTFFGAYLTETRGWSTVNAGRLWSWIGVFSLPSGFIWGWVSDRIGRRWGLITVYLIHGSCLIAFATLPWEGAIATAALIYGLSIFSVPAIMNAACGDEVGAQLAPTAFGAVTVAFGLGQMAAPAVAGAMLDMGWGMVQNLWLSALIAFLGALVAVFLHQPISIPLKMDKSKT